MLMKQFGDKSAAPISSGANYSWMNSDTSLSLRGRFISESCFLSSIDQVGKLNLKFIQM